MAFPEENTAPTLEELALTTDVDGHSCMPGAETNLGELLTTAALATPDSVCLETEDGCYTFAQATLCTGRTFMNWLKKSLVCKTYGLW